MRLDEPAQEESFLDKMLDEEQVTIFGIAVMPFLCRAVWFLPKASCHRNVNLAIYLLMFYFSFVQKQICICINGPGCHHYCLLLSDDLVSKYFVTTYKRGKVNKRERKLGGKSKSTEINTILVSNIGNYKTFFVIFIFNFLFLCTFLSAVLEIF